VPFEVPLRTADGRWVTFELLASNMLYDPDVRGMVFHGRDVTERKRMEQALSAAHQQFQAVYEHAPLSITLLDLDGMILDVNYSGCAMLGRTRADLVGTSARDVVHPDDLDYFKAVNDTLGHDAGDVVLATLARRIQEGVRDGDIVARLGGDEFVILCDTVAVGEARDIAERVRATCRTPIVLRGTEVVVDASIGIAIASAKDVPTSLLRRADTAAYAAKHAGRGRVALDHNDAAA
jgi:diguanylate cyclase (GGDEF)-like protein